MTLRDETPVGAPCWIDLMTSDPDRSLAFYGELFGWTAGAPSEEFGGYIDFSKDNRRVAGCMASHGQPGPSDVWSVYLASDDAEATAAEVVAHGGATLVPPMKVGEFGTMAFFTDSGGAAIGIWEPGSHEGLEIAGEPGSPTWFELFATDFDASVNFYRDVFGWDIHDMSDGSDVRYSTAGQGESATAGILDGAALKLGGIPAHWLVYFSVADADAALAKIVELGGSVIRPVEDTPYGRIARVADATGAHFALLAR